MGDADRHQAPATLVLRSAASRRWRGAARTRLERHGCRSHTVIAARLRHSCSMDQRDGRARWYPGLRGHRQGASSAKAVAYEYSMTGSRVSAAGTANCPQLSFAVSGPGALGPGEKWSRAPACTAGRSRPCARPVAGPNPESAVVIVGRAVNRASSRFQLDSFGAICSFGAISRYGPEPESQREDRQEDTYALTPGGDGVTSPSRKRTLSKASKHGPRTGTALLKNWFCCYG